MICALALLLALCEPSPVTGPHLPDALTAVHVGAPEPVAEPLSPPPPPYASWDAWRANLRPPQRPPVDPRAEQRVLAGVAAQREQEAVQRAAERAEREAAEQTERQAAEQAERQAAAALEAAIPPAHSATTSTRQIWDDLADCESGEWDANANPIPGSARWDYGAPGAFSRPGYDFDGGLNFHHDTWAWVASMVGLGHIDFAYNGSREEQITVGEKVQELQGWGAWPVCSRKVGLR